MAKKLVTKPAVNKCSVCGKTLTRTASGTCGALCAKRTASGVTGATLAKSKAKYTISATQASNGKFISVAQLHKVCVANYVPVSKMLKSMGGDTASATPTNPIAQVFWCNGQRYVSAWLATKTGLAAMLAQNFSKAPKPATATPTATATATATAMPVTATAMPVTAKS